MSHRRGIRSGSSGWRLSKPFCLKAGLQTLIGGRHHWPTGSNGAAVYDGGLFLHSNHGTDPIEGQANAWDLARIHLYGHLDKDAPANTSPMNLPSAKAMKKLADNDPGVKAERLATLVPDSEWDDDEDEEPIDDFEDLLGPPPEDAPKKKPKSKHAVDDEFDDLPEDEQD
jgi:hypothetical protein